MKRITVFSGAGTSAESGLKTFRDSGGLWEEFKIEDVATPQAWDANPGLVLEFYNKRRKQVLSANPNPAHYAIVELESCYDVTVITQNIDDLHERAGSKKVVHLHGEILKMRPENDENTLLPSTPTIALGDCCPKGKQLRPHVVWFGESVPMMDKAIKIIQQSDIVIIVGTSLNVYPAAGLIHYAPKKTLFYLVDPEVGLQPKLANLTVIQEKASTGIPKLTKQLLDKQAIKL